MSQPLFFRHENIPKLTPDQQSFCEKELSEEELYETLKSFKRNKCPGLDGLSAELYLTFWDSLKGKLMSVYSRSFELGIYHSP